MNNPAYKTTNSKYGESWLSTGTYNPLKGEVPTYSQIVLDLVIFQGERTLLVNHSMKAYKNERTNELLSTGVKPYNEREVLELRMSTVPLKPKKFPVDGSKFKYVKPSNYSGNPLYRTTNMDYGSIVPTNFDLPSILLTTFRQILSERNKIHRRIFGWNAK